MMGGMTDATSFGRRAAALLAADSEHLPRVLDVTVLGERRELILEEVSGPTLAAVLRQRRRLPPAEAVTVVISAVRATAAVHAAGFCGVRLDEHELRFDAAGTPMLLGLDGLSETLVAGAQGPAADWRAVAALADRLGLVAHGRVAGALGPAQVALGLALANVTAAETEQSIDRLEEALFELAEPEAVRFDASAAAEPERAQSPVAQRPRRGAAHRRPSASVLIEAFDAGPAALLAGPLQQGRDRLRELAERTRGRGRLAILAGAAAALLTAGALILIPGSDPGHGSRAADGASPPARSSVPASTATPAPSAVSTADAVLAGDDPVAAAAVLLARRDACLEAAQEARVNCLAQVADGEASALEQPARPLAALTPSLLERSGATALVALAPKEPQTAPASALLMRTEAGWRLRQLYEN